MVWKLRLHQIRLFNDGRDYSWGRLSPCGNLHWHVCSSNQSSTNFHRTPVVTVETYSFGSWSHAWPLQSPASCFCWWIFPRRHHRHHWSNLVEITITMQHSARLLSVHSRRLFLGQMRSFTVCLLKQLARRWNQYLSNLLMPFVDTLPSS